MSDFYTSPQSRTYSSAKSFSESNWTSSSTFSSSTSMTDSSCSVQPLLPSRSRSRMLASKIFPTMSSSSSSSFSSNVCTIDSSETRYWQFTSSNASSSSPRATKNGSGLQTTPQSEASDHRPLSPESFDRIFASNLSKIAVFHDSSALETKAWLERKVHSHRPLNRMQQEDVRENPQFYKMEKPPMKYHRMSLTKNCSKK